MNSTDHDTFCRPGAGTPYWFILSARMFPLGLFGQFLSAGIGLFSNNEAMELHAVAGGLFALPALVLFGGSLAVSRLRGFAWWTGLIIALYLVQIALAAIKQPAALSAHPANGALLLTASIVLLAKIERRQGHIRRLRTNARLS